MSELTARVIDVLSRVKFPGMTFITKDSHGGVHFQAAYFDADINTNLVELQYTRKWLVSPHMTDSEIVQTALKCMLTSFEHQVREKFKYRGQRVFAPHFDVEDLVALCEQGKSDAGGRK